MASKLEASAIRQGLSVLGVFQSWSVLVIQGLFYLLRHDEEDHLLKCLGSEMIGCEKTTNVQTGMASG